MKKALFFSFLIICWLGRSAFSQQTTKPPDKASNAKLPFKWDVSLKLFPHLVNGKVGFLIRYSPKQKGAFRIAFESVEFGKAKSVQYIVVVDGPRLDTIRVRTSKFGYGQQQIGYEIHFNSGRHQLYCGMDLRASFFHDKNNPADVYAYRKFDLLASPFVGLKYRLLDRLSLSTELSSAFGYQRQRLIAHNRDTISKEDRWTLSLDYYQLLNISYHF